MNGRRARLSLRELGGWPGVDGGNSISLQSLKLINAWITINGSRTMSKVSSGLSWL